MNEAEDRRAVPESGRKIDTLVIIGNGFDIWQGIRTDYAGFEAYYYDHLDEILGKLRLKKHKVYMSDGTPALDGDGAPLVFSDAELFYGDPFDPGGRLSHGFWHRFEDSLDKLDAQRLNAFFGKDRRDLKRMRRCALNAKRILRQAFCDWIGSVGIDGRDGGIRFGDNCLFVNFNYTDTLVKRFHVDEGREHHIHGAASDPDSIIFGHASHPEAPYPALYKMGGRFRGLYFVEEALYTTDKHVDDNFRELCVFFALHNVFVEDIRHIYVLGHSFGPADEGYFRHLVDATQGSVSDPEADLTGEQREYLDGLSPVDEMQLNIQYAMHNSYRTMGVIPDAYPPVIEGDAESEERLRLEAAAVHRRFLREQAERDEQMDRLFFKMLRRGLRGAGRARRGQAEEPPGTEAGALPPPDSAPPKWHVSYYSQEDKERIERTLGALGCRDLTLYPSIDQCLAPFKTGEPRAPSA